MPVGLAPVLVLAGLGRSDNEAPVLDGAGAQQNVPMRLAGLAVKAGAPSARAPASASARYSAGKRTS